MIKKVLNSVHLHSLVAQGSAAFISLMTFMLLARVLGAANLGHWVIFISIITFVEMVKSGFVQTGYIKYASGESEKEAAIYRFSAVQINIIFTIIVSVACLAFRFLSVEMFEGVVLFLDSYPVYGIISMPFYIALYHFQLKSQFLKIALFRAIQVSLFLGMVLVSWFWGLDLNVLKWGYLFSFAVLSIAFIFRQGLGFYFNLNMSRSHLQKLWSFGKYHVFSFLGTNLLKSSDTFLIAIFLGPAAVGLYSVPLKLVELLELPLRSVISTALPKLSALNNRGDKRGFVDLLHQYVGVVTLLFVPFLGLMFLLSQYLILLVGGVDYLSGVLIFKIFLVYGLLLPLDRMMGVSLDALGFPKLNFIKVMIMASVNVLGDVLVLYYSDNMVFVALVTTLNTLAGIMIGYYYLKNISGFRVAKCWKAGIETIRFQLSNVYRKIILQ